VIITVTLNTCIDRTFEIPHFRIGSHQKAKLIARKAAGKGMNISQVLQILGVSSAAFGLVGKGETDEFNRLFASSPVPVKYIPIPVSGPTRLNTTILDPEDDTETHIREEGSPIRRGEVEQLMKLLLVRIVRAGDWLVFAGSLPPGLSPSEVGMWLGRFRRKGARLAVDFSGKMLEVALSCGVDIVKPNVEELGEVCGKSLRSEAAIIRAAKGLLKSAKIVLVTMGQEGALLVSKDAVLRALPPSIRARNTVGSGDAFLAGFLYGWERHLSVKSSLAWAVAAGTAAASSVNLSALKLERVKRILKKVTLYNASSKIG